MTWYLQPQRPGVVQLHNNLCLQIKTKGRYSQKLELHWLRIGWSQHTWDAKIRYRPWNCLQLLVSLPLFVFWCDLISKQRNDHFEPSGDGYKQKILMTFSTVGIRKVMINRQQETYPYYFPGPRDVIKVGKSDNTKGLPDQIESDVGYWRRTM